MNRKRRIVIFLASLVLIFGIKLNVNASSSGSYNAQIINPVYSHIEIKQEKEINTKFATRNLILDINEEDYTDNITTAAEVIRDNSINRINTFSVYFKTITDTELDTYMVDEYSKQIVNLAISEGLATSSSGGDYLRWSWYKGNISGNWTSLAENEKYTNYIKFDFNFLYYTTLEQEQKLDEDIDEYLNTIDTTVSDFEKINTIYNYITHNVVYDDAHLEDSSYILKYSAYAAFENKTAVCQGYATLLYKMLKKAGVNNVRIVASLNHAWNIIKFDNIYYCVDATWDSECIQAGINYQFFLKGLNTFNFLQDHTMIEEYCEESFTNSYPISNTDYIFNNENNNANSDDNSNGNDNDSQDNQGKENNENSSGRIENNNTSANINTGTNNTSNTTNANTNQAKTNNSKPSKVTGFSLKTNYTNKVTLKWNKQSQVTLYKIELYNNKTKKYECKKTLNANTLSITINKLTDGTTYKFRIRAINNNGGNIQYGDYTYINVTTKPKKVTISKLKANKKKITISWKKILNSNGYILQYSEKNNFKKAKNINIKNKKTLTKTIQKLKNNKKYYIRIRAYKQVNGKKIYGDYSKVKNIKTK